MKGIMLAVILLPVLAGIFAAPVCRMNRKTKEILLFTVLAAEAAMVTVLLFSETPELLLFRMRKSGKGPEVIFGDPTLSGDNAVGVAMTGVRAIRS